MMIKRNKGFTLIELILVISIGSIMTFLSFQELIKRQDNLLAQSAGEQINKIGNAVNSYIAVHYDDLSKLQNSLNSSTDPGPRTCTTATSICTITTQTLINEGILPSTFSGTNSFNSGYSIALKRTGTAPYYNINGIVLTNNSWIGSGNKIRYDLLGTAMQKAGIDSGMSNGSTNKISGYNGSWSVDNTTFSDINKTGLLAYQVGYGTYSYSIYLRRDGTLPMTGNLDMGSQSINNANNITAAGTIQSATLKSTGATTVGTTLNVAGLTTLVGTNVNGALNANNVLTVSGASNLNSTLNVAGTTTLKGTNVNGILNANNNLITTGTTNLKGATTLNSTLNVSGTSTLAGTNINGGLTVSGSETVGGVLTVNNIINASGNINSSGQVQGSTLVSNGRTTVGEYMLLNGTAITNGSCSPNGLVGRTSTGDLLSCVSSKWTSVKGGYGGTFTTTGGEDAAGLSPVVTASSASNYLFNQGCKIRNSKTNSCGCPGGFTPVYTGDYSHIRNSGSEIEDRVDYGVWVCL